MKKLISKRLKTRKTKLFTKALDDELMKGVYTYNVEDVGISLTLEDITRAWDTLTKMTMPPMFGSLYDPLADYLAFLGIEKDSAPEKGPWFETIA